MQQPSDLTDHTTQELLRGPRDESMTRPVQGQLVAHSLLSVNLPFDCCMCWHTVSTGLMINRFIGTA